MKWRPIKTAPQDGTRIITFDPTAKIPWERIKNNAFECRRRHPVLNSRLYEFYGNPTHWMPLPEEPNEKELQLNNETIDNFKNILPKESGWHMVKWDPDDLPDLVYVHAGYKNGFISWGYYENDDPEELTEEHCKEDGQLWREATEEEIKDYKEGRGGTP